MAVILFLVFFLAPMIKVTGEDSAYLGTTHYTFTATVSPSFYLFHCGYILDPTVTTSVLGYQAGQAVHPTGFYCHINAQPSAG
jgi:hypothetical protein